MTLNDQKNKPLALGVPSTAF